MRLIQHLTAALLANMAFSYNVVPRIIQGGMGVRISSWKLAREVARKGELGIVSGTAIDSVVVRELQNGDPKGDIRRALASFPDQGMVQRIMDKYYIEGGKDENKPFRPLTMWSLNPPQSLLEIAVVSNYCEVWLAKHNDDGTPVDGLVGMNRLSKIQFPTIASLYGAILAGADYVIMGAGIPLQVPGVLDDLTAGRDATFPVDVANTADHYTIDFSPKDFWSKSGRPDLAEMPLTRPKFIPIVSSVVLAQSLLKRANGEGPNKGIDGFVIELPTAGGHNAPPRGFRYDPVAKTHALDLNEKGEPIYGPKDDVDLAKFLKASKGLPFWLAGSYAHADKFSDVIKLGGAGVQVGTMFALSRESGMEDDVKQEILAEIAEKDLEVFTDPVASPTGYPFKVLELDNSLSDDTIYNERQRQCSLGYLRSAYIDEDSGRIGYRCPAEPVDDWLKKGGDMEATNGRKCLCNALLANCGLPQTRMIKDESGAKSTYVEGEFITIGDEVNLCRRFMTQDENGEWGYSAADVVEYLKSEWEESQLKSEIGDTVFGDAAKAKETKIPPS